MDKKREIMFFWLLQFANLHITIIIAVIRCHVFYFFSPKHINDQVKQLVFSMCRQMFSLLFNQNNEL